MGGGKFLWLLLYPIVLFVLFYCNNFQHCDVAFCLVHLIHLSPHASAIGFFQIGKNGAPIQLAQCRFPGLAIFNAKILIYFSNAIHWSNLIKQHSKTVIVWNQQNADFNLRKKIIVSFIIIFGTLSFPIPILHLPVLHFQSVCCADTQQPTIRPSVLLWRRSDMLPQYETQGSEGWHWLLATAAFSTSIGYTGWVKKASCWF